MALHWPKSGVNLVGEFQASGHTLPINGSSNVVKLTHVASSITFTEAGSFTMYDAESNPSSTITISAPCKFKGKFLTFKTTGDAIVEITNIPSGTYNPPLFTALTRS